MNRSHFRLATLVLASCLAACQCANNAVKNKPKAEGELCKSDDECETLLCDKVPPGTDKVCVRKCTAGCKDTEICTPLSPSDRYACVPDVAGLCQPCQLSTDCPYPADQCIQLGGATVCARDCSFDGLCPASYRCTDGLDFQGNAAPKQCQPASGTCECIAASTGQTKPCSETNSFGTCSGVKTCVPPAGWNACTARVPAQEVCNGIDDNCNGMTDEGLGDTNCGVGECRRTTGNCVNGQPQTCFPGDAGVEICDGRDNDCDGVIDNGFNTMTDVRNCGTCNNVCLLPHATPVCSGGGCMVGMCDTGWWNADGVDLNGCEYACTLTNGGVEICDGIDNNCNGVIDEGFNLSTDPRNCGQCGNACSVNNGNIATYACVARVCGIGACVRGWDNCDQRYANGCEQNVSNDVLNCGACNNVCTVANGTPGCASSACTIASCNAGYQDCNGLVPDGCEVHTAVDVDHCGTCTNVCPTPAFSTRTCAAGACGYTCLAGHYDLNGSAADGCEYACTPVAGPDVPDYPGFVDSNCDGIDGDEAQAIFVSAVGGQDTNAGTKAAPKQTITAGINAAAASTPMKSVYVAKGIYIESITLHAGVNLYGGYDPAPDPVTNRTWQRGIGAAFTTSIVSPTTVGVRGDNLGLATEVQLFTISSANATGTAAAGDGNSSYGMLLTNAAGGVIVRGCTIRPGSGSPGASGLGGSTGPSGSVGGSAAAASPGGSGLSPCGAPGGAGGTGVSGVQGNGQGVPGNPGAGGTTAPSGGPGAPGGAGGTGGFCDATSSSSGAAAPAVTAVGGAGTAGANGNAPASPFGGLDPASGLYTPAVGASGLSGTPGGGGGGGGAGSGTAHGTNFFCTNCSAIASGGGGGGGGGACGGTPGQVGRGGGGSFGIAVVGTPLIVEYTDIATAAGGNGGTGGSGGLGGVGGTGGSGGAGETQGGCSTRSGGAGAAGGVGGGGGRGGGSPGGAGGPSVCITYRGMAPTNTVSYTCAVPTTTAPGGLGGSNGVQQAASGPAGLNTALQLSP